MYLLIALAALLALGYSKLSGTKPVPGGCSGYPAKLTNVGDNNARCVGGPANPNPPIYDKPPSKPASISGTQSPAQGSSEPLADLPLLNPKDTQPVTIFSADRSVNGWQMNPNMVDGLPFNPVTGRAAGNVLAPQPTMYSAPTDLVDPNAASDTSNVDYSD